MPNFGDTAQENTSEVSDGDEWPVVFLFVWFFFVVLSSLRSQRDTLDTKGFFSRASHAYEQFHQL